MAQHVRVPKFGNWEGDGNVPYTQYFDNARKGKVAGKLINPNDPEQNPSAFPEVVTVPHASPLRNAAEQEIPKLKHERYTNRKDSYSHHHSDSPARNDVIGWKAGIDASNKQHGEWMNTNDHRRTSRMNGGPECSIERSPLRPHYQVKSSSRGGVSSPSHGFAPSPSIPGRSKMRPTDRGDQIADKGSTVPKFGDWDVSNPSSADGYSHIFNKVREEKQVGAAKVPIIKTEPVYDNNQRQEGGNYDSLGCSCFGWARK